MRTEPTARAPELLVKEADRETEPGDEADPAVVDTLLGAYGAAAQALPTPPAIRRTSASTPLKAVPRTDLVSNKRANIKVFPTIVSYTKIPWSKIPHLGDDVSSRMARKFNICAIF